MKRRFLLFAALALSWLGGKAVAENFNMPQFGHQTITVSADNPVTFYDMNGYAGISSSSSNNSFATAIFQPAEAGNSIKITFQDLDVRNDGTSWPAYVKIYDGVFDVNSVTYPTSTSSVNKTEFPETAKQLARLDGTFTNLEYISSDATGALSVCYHYKYAKAIQGWRATVESVTLSSMTVTGAAGDNSFVDGAVWAGKANVGVAGFGITTEGYSAPDKLASFTFTCSNPAVLNPNALKLYAGQAASVAGLTEIAGSISENEGVYTFTLTTPQAFGNGANDFCLGGDILASAAFNATAAVNITGIATVGGFTTFTPATAATLTVQPMYLMGENATYAISQAANFYDEGGPEGKVIKGFNGKTVFEPTTNGKKVVLTFKNIDVFYTDYAASSTGYVDYIKVYSGNSTNEADLLWQITAAQASSSSDIVLRSTAADGKLTITHQCNISYDANLKEGWSAVVDEFTPQAMSVTSMENGKVTANVAASAEKVELASIHLITANTEPALVVKSLALNTNNTHEQISKLYLYYTKENAFATTQLIGEATVTGNNVIINATNNIAFREGDNYLWLAADIAATAVNEKKVDAVFEQLTFTDNSEQTAFTNPAGGLTIENKAIQACGSQTFTIQGEWQYTHTVASEYSTKYKAEQCDQTVIFKPMHAGNVIQIDYTDFDLYYSTSSYYGARAKYIVYAGEGTGGEKLWELDANGKQPTQIRSTASDGAITIVFNPNTTYSSYTGNGWHATVSEYVLQNMGLDDLSVEQASTKLVKLGEEKAALLNLNIYTLGSLNPLTLEALNVNLKGSEANISKVYLLQGTTVLAEADAAAVVTLNLGTVVELNEYDNNFVIAADIKADATIDATVDAALTSVTLSGNVTPALAGDPEGSRPVKNILIMEAGDNGTVTIGDNSLMFFDDGGPDEQASKSFEGYVTFVPATEGYAVELVFKNFEMGSISGDPFRIFYSNAYDPSATADKTYSYSKVPAEDESVISRAEDGAVTVFVKTPSYSQSAGFEIEVRQHLLTPLVIDNVTVTSLAPAEATKGTGDIRLLQAAVTVSGDRTPITVTGFEQTASDLLLDQHIYATGHSTTFSTANEFTDNYVIDENGVFYFWFVGSIDTDAEEGDEVTLQLNNVVCGENKIAPETAVVASIDVVSGAHGYYQIGSSYEADYPTLTAALTAISAIGMDGAVTLAVESGTYTEQVTVPEIPGAGASNTLTIRSVSGEYNDVIYQYNNALTSTQGVFTIAGADYITVQGLSFTSTYTSNQTPTLFVVNNAANHVTVDNCHFYANRQTEYTSRMDLLLVDAGENLYNNDFALTNSVFDGGYIGFYVKGHKAAADPLQQNMLIQGNIFRNQGKQQVYGDAVANLQILNNTFRQEVKSSTPYSIDWILVGGVATIENNDFLLTASAADNQSATAIYLRPNAYQDKENAEIRIINNVINVQNASSYVSYGINFNSNLPQILLAHNTIVTNAGGTASSPFYVNAELAAGSRFMNNIFQALNKGYAVRYKNASVATNVTYEHNLFYTSETFGMPTATYGTFDAWKTAIGATDEQANLNEAAVFASDNILLLRQDNDGHLLTATPLEFVTTDITGKVRAATPTIGAYEYDPSVLIIPTIAEGYPKAQNVQDVSADIVVKADNIGTAKVLVLAADAEAPTVETILAQGAEMTLSKNAEAAITISELTEETTYKAYVVTLSPIGDASDIVAATDEFTTAWTLRPVELNPIATQTVSENEALDLTASLAIEYDQAKPYTYSWHTAFDATELSNEATLSIHATRATEYICKVTDKFGQYALVSAHVLVAKDAAVATFEEYNITAGGHKMVDEAWIDNTETSLYSGTYAFGNVPNKAWAAYNGYVISADPSTVFTGNYAVDQYRSAAGGAYEGNNFGVAYYSAPSSWFAGYTDPVTLTNTDEPQVVPGFYITNSVYTLDAILHGEYANPAFSEGDYLLLTIHGYNGNNSTGDIEFYLADYRSADPAEHYAIDEWQYLDLSPLGAVTRIEYDMFTTKSDAYGFTTPTYFCLDNFGEEQPLVYTRDGLTPNRIGSICLPWSSTHFNGATFYRTLYKTLDELGEPKKLYLEEVTELEAGVPYIFVPEAEELKVWYKASTAVDEPQMVNGLQGTFVDISDGAVGAAGNVLEGNYLVYNNTFKKCGAFCQLPAYRAYIKADQIALQGAANAPQPVPGRRQLVLGGSNAPTAIDEINDQSSIINNQCYDLLGRPVDRNTTLHGVYIMNGQKMVK